ncbi:MAG: hypothetical protein AAFQ07_14310, partial [Chloroflexota bacterium]
MEQNEYETINQLLEQANRYRYCDLPNSKQTSQRLLAESRKHHHIIGQIRALLDLAHLAYIMYEFDDCYAHAEEARNLAHQNNMPIREGLALYELFKFYRLTSQTDLAVEAMYLIKELGDVHQNIDLLSCALMGLGAYECWANPTNYQQGIAYLQEAITHRSKEDSQLPVADAWVSLAIGYQGYDLEKAKTVAHQAYDIAREQKIIHSQLYALDQLCTAHADLGELEQAHEFGQRAIQFSQQHAIPTDYTLSHIAYIYRKEKKFEQAIKILDDLEVSCKASKKYHLLSYVYQDLTDIYEQQANFEKAYHYIQQYYANSQGLYDKQTQMRIEHLQTKYEVEATKREAELHKIKSQLLEQELAQQKAQETQRIEQLRLDLATQKQQILERLAHDFRTPLSVIQMATTSLDR